MIFVVAARQVRAGKVSHSKPEIHRCQEPLRAAYSDTQMRRTRSVLRYLFAVLTVAAALGVRMLLRPWTGVGAPFVFFFSTVLVSSVFWGAGPGLLAGFIAASISAFLFVSQAGYTTTQAISQTVLFLLETSIVCILADRFANAKRRSELYERAARQAARTRSWSGQPR